MAHKNSTLKLSHISIQYGANVVINNLSGSFESGSLTAIIGPNGGGKSTLLKMLMGFISQSKGTYTNISKNKAYLPQRSEIDMTFPISVIEFVSMGLWQKNGSFKGFTLNDQALVENALVQVGMERHRNAQINILSGGQLQRVLFARLSLQNAELILLDEPFTGVDSHTTKDLMSLIHDWHHEGRTIITVLHDLELVRRAFPKCLLLSERSLGWGDTSDVLTTERLQNFHLCSHSQEMEP